MGAKLVSARRRRLQPPSRQLSRLRVGVSMRSHGVPFCRRHPCASDPICARLARRWVAGSSWICAVIVTVARAGKAKSLPPSAGVPWCLQVKHGSGPRNVGSFTLPQPCPRYIGLSTDPSTPRPPRTGPVRPRVWAGPFFNSPAQSRMGCASAPYLTRSWPAAAPHVAISSLQLPDRAIVASTGCWPWATARWRAALAQCAAR